MDRDRYFPPDNCQEGKQYYLKLRGQNGKISYMRVRFKSYRPHPGEVVVECGRKAKIIHRRFLFSKSAGSG